ncbi:MAG: isocitrate/isopropylmalate dehydrogenase family protein [Myxococcales bacterium]|nr:isocitrate/isopropylmalate dehydrogenase family protein [Myxococcales bacterium]
MADYRLTLIPGDGIGPEVTEATQRVIAAAGVSIDWEEVYAGQTALDKGFDVPLPEVVLESIRKNRVGLKGPCGTPIGKGFTSVNVRLRQALDLYACVRPTRSFLGVRSRAARPFEGVDLVIVRENTEGLYSGIEHQVVDGVIETLKIVTERASRRIVKHAFEYCRSEGRRRVTAIHKQRVMKLSDGLFLRVAREVAEEYPFIAYDEMSIDNMAMKIALDPTAFDVLVMENLFGDVVSDMCAGMVGGLGLVPGANIGDRYAVFEAVHGSAPDIAGKGIANPTALILSACLMLKHIGERRAAWRIEMATRKVIEAGDRVTGDLGGSATTREMTEAIIVAMEGLPK